MKWVKLREVYGRGFRSFVDPFRVQLPNSGLTLIKGLNRDTGDSSGSGKSSLVLAISSLFGGCPYPGTENQSWHTEEPSLVGAVIETPEGLHVVERCGGLLVKKPDGSEIRGRSADAELTRIFGMSDWLRSATTYRGQGEGSRFLGMSDADKKKFFTAALHLDKYEREAKAAAEAAKSLRDSYLGAEGALKTAQEIYAAALKDLNVARALAAACGSADALRASLVEIESIRKSAASKREELRQETANSIGAIKQAAEAKIAEIQAATIQEASSSSSPELDALKAELAKTQERLKKVVAHDAKRALEEKGTLGELRIAIERATAAWRQVGRLKVAIAALKEQEQSIRRQTCPTCSQQWLADSEAALEEVMADIRSKEVELQGEEALSSQLRPLDEKLKAIPPFQPHAFVAQLKAKEVELRKAIEETTSRARTERDSLLESNRAAVADIKRRAQADVATLEAALRAAIAPLVAEEAALEERVDFIDGQISEAHSAAVGLASSETRYESAVARLAASEAALENAQRAINAELDFQALVGNSGYLGVIFDDVLAEVAAATNEILSRVANVRHVSFEFETERETKSDTIQRRITPVVIIGGRRVPFDSGPSGGMKNAIGFAVDLGVGEVVAKRRGSYPNWLVLDESFDGLGPHSKESCLEMLQLYANERLVLVIDHSTEFQGLFPQSIQVVFSKGRSSIQS